MTPQPVSIALVALGGYGKFYVSALLDEADPNRYRIVGAIDPLKERRPRLTEIQAKNIPIYDTLEEFYANGKADLVTIASPIHFHCDQTCVALDNGSNVLCEKPLGATIQEARRMIEARDRAGKFVAIGYQWSYSKAVQELKRDIREGRLGRPRRLKTIALWPRDEVYYTRNSWAGRQRGERGAWILDSPINNAVAHYLHNMVYVLGDQTDRSARPASVTAELYRANAIENFDTGAARILTDAGVEVLFYATHAVTKKVGPIFEYEFDNATVRDFVAHFKDGSVKEYGDPGTKQYTKLWDAMAAVRDEKEIVCGPEAASALTLCVNGMQDSMPEIVEFPQSFVRVEGQPGSRRMWVEGLFETMWECYNQGKLPSELGVSWAMPGKEVSLLRYGDFPGGL